MAEHYIVTWCSLPLAPPVEQGTAEVRQHTSLDSFKYITIVILMVTLFHSCSTSVERTGRFVFIMHQQKDAGHLVLGSLCYEKLLCYDPIIVFITISGEVKTIYKLETFKSEIRIKASLKHKLTKRKNKLTTQVTSFRSYFRG